MTFLMSRRVHQVDGLGKSSQAEETVWGQRGGSEKSEGSGGEREQVEVGKDKGQAPIRPSDGCVS